MRDDFGEQDRMEFVTDRETRQEDKGGEEIRSENVFEEAKNITAQKPGEDGKGIRKLWNWGKRHPFLSLLFLSMAVPMVVLLLVVLIKYDGFEGLYGFGTVGILLGVFFVLPWVLTGAEIYLAIKAHGREKLYRKGRIFDVITIPLGVIYSILYLQVLGDVMFASDWSEVLYNSQVHTPVYTQSAPTIWVLALVGFAGYLAVSFLPLEKTPPLVTVLGMAAMYLGTTESILWGIQVCSPLEIFLPLLPLNCVIITARTVRHKVWEWKQLPHEERQNGSLLGNCDRLLMRSERWPFLAFVLMWPLLGILIALLFLAGQEPDAVIKAFTETADWNLSRRVAPQNLHYDEHYLCTVAAGGHKKIVKPLRLGVRHGHEVIVNRQLCVANAFEQILEEKTPGLHRAVRHLYDTWGFPVARLIRSRCAADVVYFLMKPLEWFFLIVLYLSDAKPENRIALQYTGKSLKDFQGREWK